MKPHNTFLIFLLGCLAAITPLSIDIYLPGFVNIATDFATTLDKVSSSLSAFLIGVAVCQLFYGPLLDRFGRKPPLLTGLLVYCIASFACMLSQTLISFIFFRLLQAVGCCVAMVAATAIIRDVFSQKDHAKVLSIMILILGTSPKFAPSIGSLILAESSWRILFAVMGGFALIILIGVMIIFKESKLIDKTVSLRAVKIIRTYVGIFTNKRFYPFATTFASAGFFAYLAGSPHVLLKFYGVTQHTFGILFGAIALGLILCSQVNNLLLKKYSSKVILQKALFVQSGLGIVSYLFLSINYLNLIGFFILAFLFVGCLGFIFSNATALSILSFDKEAGSASALLGSLQMGAGAVSSSILSIISNGSGKPMMLLMLIGACLASYLCFLFSRVMTLKVLNSQ